MPRSEEQGYYKNKPPLPLSIWQNLSLMVIRYIKKFKNFLENCWYYRNATPNDYLKYVLTKDKPFVEMRDDLELARMVKQGMIRLSDLQTVAEILQTLNTPTNRSRNIKTSV